MFDIRLSLHHYEHNIARWNKRVGQGEEEYRKEPSRGSIYALKLQSDWKWLQIHLYSCLATLKLFYEGVMHHILAYKHGIGDR